MLKNKVDHVDLKNYLIGGKPMRRNSDTYQEKLEM
jgi:hypothetical protein